MAAKQNQQHRLEFLQWLWTVEDPSTLLFVDESAKGSQSEKRRSFWCPEGVSTSLTEDFAQTTNRYTLLAAVNMDG